MNWTLREKTGKEIDDMKNLMRGYKNFNPQVCPLEVTKGNGEVKDVWNLTEEEVYKLIRLNIREFEEGRKDNVRIAWTSQILNCWKERHPSISLKMTTELIRIQADAKTPVSRDVVGSFVAPIASSEIEKIKIVATYLNGMKTPSDGQMLQVAENMAQMLEQQGSKSI